MQLEMQFRRLNIALTDMKSLVQHDDYKIENYDRIKMSVSLLSL